jgi:hypothetical protein
MDSVQLSVAFSASQGLGAQFDKVARVIKLRDQLDLERMAFVTLFGGFDTHFALDDDIGESMSVD